MQIVFPDAADEQTAIRSEMRDASVKFAMFRRGPEIHTRLFGTHTQHSHFVEDTVDLQSSLILVGAGFVKKGKAEWGSESCEQDYGYDRPEQEADRQALLKQLQDAIDEL